MGRLINPFFCDLYKIVKDKIMTSPSIVFKSGNLIAFHKEIVNDRNESSPFLVSPCVSLTYQTSLNYLNDSYLDTTV